MANENEIITIQEESDALMNFDYDSVIVMAERADKMVGALNRIMQAAIKVTTPKDWVLIGGVPYLQETGASKVAGLFGIGWQICDGFPTRELDSNGFPTYTYRMIFSMQGRSIVAEGMRSASDDFFTGKGKKGLDAIDLADVKRAAYTNCLNRGIKGILPGLRNLDVATLEAAGINLDKTDGYTFKEGSKGGSKAADDSGLVCEGCGEKISQKVASFSEGKYGRRLCMNCQKKAAPADKPSRAKKPAPKEEEPSAEDFPPNEYWDNLMAEGGL